MSKKIRLVAAICVIASIAGLVYLAVSQYIVKSAVKATPALSGDISGKIENIHFSSARRGKLEWELDAKSALRRKSGSDVTLESVVMLIHASRGDLYTVKAKDAVYNQSSGVIDASGGVTVEIKSGTTMKTGRVEYSTKTKKASTNDDVVISSGKMKITGSGLVMEPEKGKFSILKNVKAVITESAK